MALGAGQSEASGWGTVSEIGAILEMPSLNETELYAFYRSIGLIMKAVRMQRLTSEQANAMCQVQKVEQRCIKGVLPAVGARPVDRLRYSIGHCWTPNEEVQRDARSRAKPPTPSRKRSRTSRQARVAVTRDAVATMGVPVFAVSCEDPNRLNRGDGRP